ncbi:aspartate carbamoyltransferase catalytic subunit, partial [Klebsiella pneumoniae]|nr:aspartate carbamoyltransferase catalytic subunit [Klebsiella pneumoniae]
MNEQLAPDGRLRHLLTLDGLPRTAVEALLDRAQAIVDHGVAGAPLAGQAVCTLFFEPSTRT